MNTNSSSILEKGKNNGGPTKLTPLFLKLSRLPQLHTHARTQSHLSHTTIGTEVKGTLTMFPINYFSHIHTLTHFHTPIELTLTWRTHTAPWTPWRIGHRQSFHGWWHCKQSPGLYLLCPVLFCCQWQHAAKRPIKPLSWPICPQPGDT